MKKILTVTTLIIAIMLPNFALASLKNANEPVFSYRVLVSLGNVGDYGGYDLKLFKNGEIELNELKIGSCSSASTIFYAIPIAAVKEIYDIIEGADIKNIPLILDNGSKNGIVSSFGFNYTYINGINLSITNENEIKEEFIENAHYENTVLELFNNIGQVFLQYGFELKLYSFEIMG